jgi:hypothetical protein
VVTRPLGIAATIFNTSRVMRAKASEPAMRLRRSAQPLNQT